MTSGDEEEQDSDDLIERDSKRDIGAEILDAIRQFKDGTIGAVHGPPGTVVLRCVDLGSLGDISGDDLNIGKIYVGRKDREDWVRIICELSLVPRGMVLSVGGVHGSSL